VLALPARKETGANVMKAMENLKEQIELVNRTVLEPRNLGLELTQVYDETMYITSAIRLVVNNLLFGGVLAITVLLLFLRSGSATGIIAVAIPISVIGTFLVITLLGRSLNVVMLAGMAFAVGMVVDNAIVVLENIFRHRSMGKSKFKAALDGAREVWGAVLASTLTTMAVFLPVIFIEEEAGQLFRDIAIAIAAAVGLSLIVSVLVIPPLAARFFQAGRAVRIGSDKPWRFAALVSRLTAVINQNLPARIGVVAGFSGAAVLGSRLLMPATEYLPAGNQNLVFGILISPPGYALDEFRQMALLVEEGAPDDPVDGLKPFWEAPVGQAAHLPPVEMTFGKGGSEIVREVAAPPIENFFFVVWAGSGFMGCTSKEPTKVKPLENVMARAASRIPGVFGGFVQASIFQLGHGQGNSVDVEIRGENLNEVIASASAILRRVLAEGYSYPQPSPGNFDLGRPEYQIIPKRTQAADLGFDVRQLGFVAESCIDGAFVGEFNDKGDKIDMVIKVQGTKRANLRDLGEIPVYTSTGKVVPIASVVDVRSTTAPQQINHIEEMGSVTLSVKPKQGVPLQETMRELEEDVIAPLRAGGLIAPSVITTLAGTADKLTQTQRALAGDFAGTVTRPRLFGLSVAVSLGVIAVCILIVAFALRAIAGPRPAVMVATLCFVLLALGFVAANPLLPLRVLESRMVLALLITYLLMAALFESFAYPFVIMFSVPLAAVGGFASLRIVHEISYWNAYSPIQQLDVLTMLGFVILIGIVVNNAILLVHQALNYVRDEGMDPQRAIIQSVQTRTRPIFMGALTSVFGMTPLVVMPGAGSELYRGLGSVVVGGLIVSTVFTLVVVPSMFSLFISFEAWYAKALGTRRTAEAETAPQPTPVAGSSEA
jgi:HAE1 family hydrophobic/amphiphilic exporter-1